MEQIKPPVVELTPRDKIGQIHLIAIPLAIEKSHLAAIPTQTSLDEINERIRLQAIVPSVEQKLIQLGIHIDTTHLMSDRRKGEFITTLAAATIIQENNGSHESIQAGALLLSSQVPIEMQMKALHRTSVREDNNLGLQSDLVSTKKDVGFVLSTQIQRGSVDRLLGTCVVSLRNRFNLPQDVALDIGLSLVTGNTPKTIEAAKYMQQAKMTYEVAQSLVNRMPKAGLKQEDVPFSPITDTALRLVEQAEQLQNPQYRLTMMQEIVEQGTIPTKITNLTDILSIVDHNPEIRAVSFDMYDTLVQWTSDQTERRLHHMNVVSIALEKKNIHIPKAELQKIIDDAWRVRWENYQAQGTELPIEQTMDTVTTELEKKGVFHIKDPKKLEEMKNDVSQILTRTWYDVELETAVAMPGARDTLDELKKRGIKVCITSNASWSRRHMYHVLNRFGLDKYIDTLTISSEDTSKPWQQAEKEAYDDYAPERRNPSIHRRMKKGNQSEFFHYAWSKLNIAPEAILHVGDNPWDDVQGGAHAGAKTTLYDNPLAYRRLEQDAKFRQNPTLYAETANAMGIEALDKDITSWLHTEMRRKHIPEKEQVRVETMAREIYRRSRDIYAPAYIATSEELLHRLQDNQVDQVICMARDGLPLSVTSKLLLHFEHDRFPNVNEKQIRYIHTSRSILKRVSGVDVPLEQDLKNRYVKYLDQSGVLGRGKRTVLTDLLCGSGLTHNLLSGLLESQGQTVSGFYLDSHQPNIEGFLQKTTGENHPFLVSNEKTSLLFFESLFNGPKSTVKEFVETTVPSGSSVRPKVKEKQLTPDVLTRGLSKESVLFFNHVAIKGLMDSVRIHNRGRLTGAPQLSDRDIAARFVRTIMNAPTDDIRRSIPWEDSGKWFLPSQNPLEQHL